MSEQARKVLVIDDNEQMLRLAQDTLEDAGYCVFLARNGVEGIAIAMEEKTDVILLDIMMPGMNGYEVCKSLKEGLSDNAGKIIMVSAKAHSRDKVNGLDAGADDYLTKPYHTDELVARVKAQCRIKKAEDERADLLEAIQSDIAVGANIQQRYLTKSDDLISIFHEAGFKAAVYNKAPNTISGDFFFAKRVGEKGVGLFFGDMCGHGIPAALISMRILSIIDQMRSPGRHPSEFLEMLNRDIQGLIPERRFVACSYIIFDATDIMVSNAAQPFTVLVKAGVVSELKTSNAPLGMQRNVRYDDVVEDFDIGDKAVLYTDGVVEAANPDEQIYGNERLLSLIARHSGSSPDELCMVIKQDVEKFTAGKPVDDDITIIAIEKIGG